MQPSGLLELAMEPRRGDIKAVRPCRRAGFQFQEHAFEVLDLPQRLCHRIGTCYQGRKIIIAAGAIAECEAEAVAFTPLNLETLIMIETRDPLQRKLSAGTFPIRKQFAAMDQRPFSHECLVGLS